MPDISEARVQAKSAHDYLVSVVGVLDGMGQDLASRQTISLFLRVMNILVEAIDEDNVESMFDILEDARNELHKYRRGGFYGRAGQLEFSFKFGNSVFSETTDQAISKVDKLISFAMEAAEQDNIDAILASNVSGALESAPEQQVAPFQFGVVEEVLTVVSQPISIGDPDADSRASALRFLIAWGEDIAGSLEGMNSGKRVVAAFNRLLASLREPANAVVIGIASDVIVQLVEDDEELSDRYSKEFRTFGLQTGRFAAQFEDWREYSEQAHGIEISHDTATAFAKAIGELAEAIGDQDNNIDSSVKTALIQSKEWGERAVTAKEKLTLAATLSNYVSGVSFYVLDSAGSAVLGQIAIGTVIHLLGPLQPYVAILPAWMSAIIKAAFG